MENSKNRRHTVIQTDISVGEMVYAYLFEGEYTGLVNPDAECGCNIENLAPCEKMNHQGCFAIYRRDEGK